MDKNKYSEVVTPHVTPEAADVLKAFKYCHHRTGIKCDHMGQMISMLVGSDRDTAQQVFNALDKIHGRP